ncbi:At2g23090 like protein [Calycina marina]|uniref:At2g23090 like protein n=1 Tax=Calycina marina TaxID=1763456 RepID=A0A9P7ZD33_9HELO|nr:At2g23090 like protein [Calycina marina]
MGNGAKAASKRDRKDNDTKVAKSQLKVNEKAMDIQCQVCKATFLKTSRAPALTEHASNKHSKTIKECFPTFEEAPAKAKK